MSGTVGIIANDNARYTLFSISLTQLAAPPNTKIDWAVTSDRIIGRNKLTERALESGQEWLLFIDDDHVFPTDILVRLLAHDLPIVGALYCQRMRPFRPVAYLPKDEDGLYGAFHLENYGKDEVVEVAALGTGGMLIRSEVFHAMPYPWFEHGLASEDMIFCDKARELGFPVHVDLGVKMKHMLPSAVWPRWDEERGWVISFDVADGFRMDAQIEVEGEDVDPAIEAAVAP